MAASGLLKPTAGYTPKRMGARPWDSLSRVWKNATCPGAHRREAPSAPWRTKPLLRSIMAAVRRGRSQRLPFRRATAGPVAIYRTARAAVAYEEDRRRPPATASAASAHRWPQLQTAGVSRKPGRLENGRPGSNDCDSPLARRKHDSAAPPTKARYQSPTGDTTKVRGPLRKVLAVIAETDWRSDRYP